MNTGSLYPSHKCIFYSTSYIFILTFVKGWVSSKPNLMMIRQSLNLICLLAFCPRTLSRGYQERGLLTIHVSPLILVHIYHHKSLLDKISRILILTIIQDRVASSESCLSGIPEGLIWRVTGMTNLPHQQ